MLHKINQSLIIFLVISLFISLQGCMSAAMTGVQALYNRHSIQKNLNDQYITLQAYRAFNRNSNHFKGSNISIATFNGDVLIAGQAPHVWQKEEAETLIKNIPSVGRVYDKIAVTNPSSTLTRMSDTWITTKIKAKLLASADVDATKVKVVTENGIVYLMGILPSDEASAAVTLANETDGVAKVINLFSYISITTRAFS